MLVRRTVPWAHLGATVLLFALWLPMLAGGEEAASPKADAAQAATGTGSESSAIVKGINIRQGAGSFYHGLVSSFGLILACEIGDRTFFIAAILSMKHSCVVIFSGAISALAAMTVVSATVGILLPNLLSPRLTHYVCASLFLYFGGKLLWDAYNEEGDGENEELEEVERELEEDPDKAFEESEKLGLEEDEIEDVVKFTEASGGPSPQVIGQKAEDGEKPATGKVQKTPSGTGATKSYRGPFIQAFTMTFLAEWGDRSQIATIALGAAENLLGVCIGAVAGHSICTGFACWGGKMLAANISERIVGFIGGALFLFFGVAAFVAGPPAAASN